MLKIIIGGDTVPTKSNENRLINKQDNLVFNDVKNVFLSADIVIVNLECPLTNAIEKINKFGPCLKAVPETIHGLRNAGITVFSLANNHIMDYGVQGLKDTVKSISESGAVYIGVGNTLGEARKIHYFNEKGHTIALISVAEHEFSIAEDHYPGANPFDPFDTIEDIEEANKVADSVIVLYHGGNEHYEWPSPYLQRICRKMVEHGADYVVCQHSHCIGSYEKYRNGHIIYGQGNLLFDYLEHKMWQTGLLVEITIDDDNKNGRIDFIPVRRDGFSIDLAKGADKDNILSSFYNRNIQIHNEQFIQQQWSEFSANKRYIYIQYLLGFSNLARKIDRRLGYMYSKMLFHKSRKYLMSNLFNCQSHFELIRTILKSF